MIILTQYHRARTLSETEWNNLLSVIDNSGFTGFETLYEPGSGVADFFTYSLAVKRGSSTKRVEWVDDWASESELPVGLKDIEEHILSIVHGTESGGVEGVIFNELGRPVAGLIVSIVDGSVGFPEIAVLTRARARKLPRCLLIHGELHGPRGGCRSH